MSMRETLLPDRLRTLWESVETRKLTPEQFEAQQEQLMAEYRLAWSKALLLDDERHLTPSLMKEVALYVGLDDPAEAERRCREGVTAVKTHWEKTFRKEDLQTAEKFYHENEPYIYDLMWWHTLQDDSSPLAYVLALRFAAAHGCSRHLDFGAGAGAGSILFGRNGFQVTLADISSTLLQFSRWRFQRRSMPAQFIDLKTQSLPPSAFDVITAMDVFEHLVDPVRTIEQIVDALVPGGYLIGRFEPAADLDHPQHIVLDFGPTFRRMQELGLTEVWRDEWLWGHQVFRKT